MSCAARCSASTRAFDRGGDAVEVVVEDADADRQQQRVDGLLVRAGDGVDGLLRIDV